MPVSVHFDDYIDHPLALKAHFVFDEHVGSQIRGNLYAVVSEEKPKIVVKLFWFHPNIIK